MRTFFGVIFAMLATLCGGCSLLFLNTPIGDAAAVVISLGGIPAFIFGLIAWNLLKKKPARLSPPVPMPSKADDLPEDPFLSHHKPARQPMSLGQQLGLSTAKSDDDDLEDRMR